MLGVLLLIIFSTSFVALLYWLNSGAVSIRISDPDPLPNRVMEIILENDNWKVKQDAYHVYFKNDKYELEFWIANGDCAFADRGKVLNKKTEEFYEWDSKMPSDKHIKMVKSKMKELLIKNLPDYSKL